MKLRKYTIAQITQIIALHNEGLGYTRISKHTHIHYETVKRYIRLYARGLLKIEDLL